MTLKELEENNIPCFPDNDGNLWFWKIGGGTEIVEEESKTRIEERSKE